MLSDVPKQIDRGPVQSPEEISERVIAEAHDAIREIEHSYFEELSEREWRDGCLVKLEGVAID